MKQYLETHLYIAFVLVTLALAVGIGAFVADYNAQRIEEDLRNQLAEQELYLRTLAELTDRNAPDEGVASALKDCERRADFNALLAKLGSLPKKDLLTTQNLFEECGAFDRKIKALMAGKLEREVAVYQNLLTLLKTLTERDLREYDEDVWREIVSEEKLRSALLSDLTDIQEEIIVELIKGSSPSGPTVSALVTEALNISQRLIVSDRKIDEAREMVND